MLVLWMEKHLAQQLWKELRNLGSSSSWKGCLDYFLLPFFMCHLQLLMKNLNQLFLDHFSPWWLKKLGELRDLDAIRNGQGAEALLPTKDSSHRTCRNKCWTSCSYRSVDSRLHCLPAFAEREEIQKNFFKLPALPTTTMVHSLKRKKFVLNVWPSVRVN